MVQYTEQSSGSPKRYINHGVTLTKGQVAKMKHALDKDCEVTIKISKNNLVGDNKLPLTKTQFNKITKSKTGVELTLSKTQLKHMEKTGGFLPLLAAIPAIIGALGGLAGGITSAVNSSKQTAEQARHNREMEKINNVTKEGGFLSNQVATTNCFGSKPTSMNGRSLSNTLSKYGLGGNTKGLRGAVWGNGLYLERKGSGLFLERQ